MKYLILVTAFVSLFVITNSGYSQQNDNRYIADMMGGSLWFVPSVYQEMTLFPSSITAAERSTQFYSGEYINERFSLFTHSYDRPESPRIHNLSTSILVPVEQFRERSFQRYRAEGIIPLHSSHMIGFQATFGLDRDNYQVVPYHTYPFIPGLTPYKTDSIHHDGHSIAVLYGMRMNNIISAGFSVGYSNLHYRDFTSRTNFLYLEYLPTAGNSDHISVAASVEFRWDDRVTGFSVQYQNITQDQSVIGFEPVPRIFPLPQRTRYYYTLPTHQFTGTENFSTLRTSLLYRDQLTENLLFTLIGTLRFQSGDFKTPETSLIKYHNKSPVEDLRVGFLRTSENHRVTAGFSFINYRFLWDSKISHTYYLMNSDVYAPYLVPDIENRWYGGRFHAGYERGFLNKLITLRIGAILEYIKLERYRGDAFKYSESVIPTLGVHIKPLQNFSITADFSGNTSVDLHKRDDLIQRDLIRVGLNMTL